MLRLYPDVAGKFLEILSHEIRKKDGYLCSLPQSVRKRISEAILRLYQHEDGIETLSVRGTT
jgi:hypothetical protein